MLSNIILSFLAGVFGENAIPHFVKGITKESLPLHLWKLICTEFRSWLGWLDCYSAACLLCRC